MLEHLLDPLPRDVPGSLAVDRVADLHVVGRHRFGHRAGGSPYGEEPPRHLLPGPDLGKRPINLPVDVDGQGTLGNRVGGVAHRIPPGMAACGGDGRSAVRLRSTFVAEDCALANAFRPP